MIEALTLANYEAPAAIRIQILALGWDWYRIPDSNR
jgi:hypothetical protein